MIAVSHEMQISSAAYLSTWVLTADALRADVAMNWR